jgi:acyl-coenzyme A thioesterase PaaI-like protein
MQNETLVPVIPIDSHSGCLLCGNHNPLSMKLKFAADPQLAVHADFRPHEMLQGYRGILHGGVICALLDSAMVNCLFHQNISALTAEMKTRFLQPVSCNNILHLHAWVEKKYPPLFVMKAELSCQNQICAWAEAKFMENSNLPEQYPGA